MDRSGWDWSVGASALHLALSALVEGFFPFRT